MKNASYSLAKDRKEVLQGRESPNYSIDRCSSKVESDRSATVCLSGVGELQSLFIYGYKRVRVSRKGTPERGKNLWGKSNVLLAILLLIISCVPACRSLEEETSVDPEKERVRRFWQAYNQATRYRTQNRFQDAIQSYQEALELNPEHEESLYYLGNCNYEIGRNAEAAREYEKILALNSRSTRALSQLGILLSTPEPGAMLDLERAEELFRQVRVINPEESGSFIRSGLVAAQRQDWSESYKQFMTAAGFRSPEGLFLAGAVRFMGGNYREATGLFVSVLKINAQERQISGRGVTSEGDVRSDSEAALNLMEKAGVKSLVWLNWAANALGAYPADVPAEFQIRNRPKTLRLESSSLTGRTEWSDWDHDGDVDSATAGPDGTVRLFRNTRGKMEDVTAATGIAGTAFSLLWIDYNRDGRMDLYALGAKSSDIGGNRMYRNDGHGKFSDVTEQIGLSGERSTTAALALDVDLDGDSDLIEGGNLSDQESSLRLYWNDNGVFRRASDVFHPVPAGHVVALTSADYNADRLQDILVTIWKRDPVLYENHGGKKFEDRTEKVGLAGIPGQSFCSLFWRFDEDDFPDLLITQWAPYAVSLLRFVRPDAKIPKGGGTPRLFLNTRAGSFREVTSDAGLSHAYGTMYAEAADLNNDTHADIVLGNGGLEVLRLEPSVILWNIGGKKLEEAPIPASGRALKTHHVSIADSDGDGKPEIYLSSGHLVRN